MATPKVANRYPRPGERIAPFASARRFDANRYPNRCAINSAAWSCGFAIWTKAFGNDFRPMSIRQLALAVVDCVSTHQVLKTLHDRRFPRPLPGLRLRRFAFGESHASLSDTRRIGRPTRSGLATIRWARFFPSGRLGRDVCWICLPLWSRCRKCRMAEKPRSQNPQNYPPN